MRTIQARVRYHHACTKLTKGPRRDPSHTSVINLLHTILIFMAMAESQCVWARCQLRMNVIVNAYHYAR